MPHLFRGEARSVHYNKVMSSLPLPLAAFVAGLISFLSPCVLPLVPGYVSLISGVGVEELKSDQSQVFRKVMLNSLASPARSLFSSACI